MSQPRFCYKKNTVCQQIPQLWYYVKALNNVKNSKNKFINKKNMKIVNYYSNNKGIIN